MLNVFDLYPIIAASVDAERAFSRGRLQVNHLQHNLSSQSFKAQMAVGSWASTPLYPGLASVTKIVKTCMGQCDDSVEDDAMEPELHVEPI